MTPIDSVSTADVLDEFETQDSLTRPQPDHLVNLRLQSQVRRRLRDMQKEALCRGTSPQRWLSPGILIEIGVKKEHLADSDYCRWIYSTSEADPVGDVKIDPLEGVNVTVSQDFLIDLGAGIRTSLRPLTGGQLLWMEINPEEYSDDE